MGYVGLFAGARGQWLKETGQKAGDYAEFTRGEYEALTTEEITNERWRIATQIVPADVLPSKGCHYMSHLTNMKGDMDKKKEVVKI